MAIDNRVIEFIQALRSNGARVSLAESADGMRAIEAVGVVERETLKIALRSALVKDISDVQVFDKLFPHYFGYEAAPLQPPSGLSKEENEQLQAAIEELREKIRELMRMLANGEQPSKEQMEQMARQAGVQKGMRGSPQMQQWLTERMLRQMGLTPEQLKDALEALLKQLKLQGMDPDGRQEVRDTVRENAQTMRDQVQKLVGQSMQRQPEDGRRRQRVEDLMNRPLASLNDGETDELRAHVRRLVARLRSRAALRMRRAKREKLDVKRTLRANQRYGGVPIELKQKRKALKPKITVIVDVSTSMRPVAEFMLRMVYEMQDQISKARSFAFISDIHEVSYIFGENRPEDAIPLVLDLLPPGHYSTDLGNSLNSFYKNHLDAVDARTTLIFVGDGRNNYNDPRTDLASLLRMRCKRVLWFNPEPPMLWNTGDSDMARYAPLASAVHNVATLKQLEDAIDDLFQR